MTFADKAHRFCMCLFRKSDEAFGVLQTALVKERMTHIKDELERIGENGWVQDGLLRNINRGPFYLYGLNLIPAYISNHMPSKERDEITYPFPNIISATPDVWEWISKSIPHFIMDLFTYSHWSKVKPC